MAAKKEFQFKSLLPPVVVVAALGWLSTVEVELPDVYVEEQIIELRDRFYDVVTPNDQVVWAVGKNGKIVRSDDRGQTFRVQSTPTITHFQSIAAWDDQTAVVIGNDAQTIHTSDGGSTWELVRAPMGDVAKKMFRAEIAPDGRLWATAEFGVILYSDDRGESWNRVGGGQDVAWNDLGFPGNGRVCVVGEFGQIECSDDQGETWVPRETPLDSSLMAVAFDDLGRGLSVGVDGHVIQTQDYGDTWTVVKSPTSKHLYGIARNDDQWIVVGEKGAFLHYDPARDEWIEENLGSLGNVWYTGVENGHGGTYISGQILALWKDGALKPFGRQMGGADLSTPLLGFGTGVSEDEGL